MNTRLLRKIQKQIAAEPRQFQMELYFHNDPETIPNCGTAACIGGWAVALSKGVTPNVAMELDRNTYETTSRQATDALGLSYFHGQRLFHVGHWPEPFQSMWDKLAADSRDDVNTDGEDGKQRQAKREAIRQYLRGAVAIARIEHFINTGGKS